MSWQKKARAAIALFVIVFVPVLALRILDEEAMLLRELDGYAEYTRSVRYRLVPGLY